jgi:hypothetical protein
MTASPRTPPPADVTMLLRDHLWYLVDPANPASPTITALWGDPASGVLTDPQSRLARPDGT